MNFRHIILLIPLMAALVAARPVLTPARLAQVMPSVSWLDGWQYRQPITISSNLVSAGNALTNFVYVINITNNASFAAHAKADAADFRFTASDGATLLTSEVESFTNSTGALVAACRLPLLPSTSSPVIYVYYGNASASAPANAAQTWAGFNSVWNLARTNSTDNTWADSTGAHNATNVTATAVAGQIDGAAGFETGKYAIGAWTNFGTTAKTISLWAYAQATTSAQGWFIIKGGATAGELGFYLETQESGNKYKLSLPGNFGSGWGDNYSTAAISPAPTNAWHHYSATWDGANILYFFDGAQLGNAVAKTGTIANTHKTFGIGNETSWNSQIFLGQMDAIRISDEARSAAWIRAEFLNQASNTVYQTLSAEESR